MASSGHALGVDVERVVHFLGAADAGTREVPDPYDGGPEGFERMLDLIEAASRAWVATLLQRAR